jgi:hypothetical protein
MSNTGDEQPSRLHILIVANNPTAATVQKKFMVNFNCEVDIAVTK